MEVKNSSGYFKDPVTFEDFSTDTPRMVKCALSAENKFTWPMVATSNGDLVKIVYKFFEHAPAKTSEEVAKIRGTPLETGAKAMIIKVDNEFILIVIPANKKFNSKPAKKYLHTNCLRFAYKEELEFLTHCLQGAVPPFGSLFGLKTYVDESLFNDKTYDYISFNGGMRTRSFQISKDDYAKLENPTILNICK